MRYTTNVRCTAKPTEAVQGPSATLCHLNIHKYTGTDPVTGEATSGWEYDEYSFPNYEYGSMLGGICPQGAQWDEGLRAIQRAHLLRKATDMIVRHQTYDPDTEELAKWTQYAQGVLATTQQPGYPQSCEYPAQPDEPTASIAVAIPSDATAVHWRCGGSDWGSVEPSTGVAVLRPFQGRDLELYVTGSRQSWTVASTEGCEVSSAAVGSDEKGAVTVRLTATEASLTIH